jgi:hypothetical protein
MKVSLKYRRRGRMKETTEALARLLGELNKQRNTLCHT